VARAAAPIALPELGLSVATDSFVTVSMTLDHAQNDATIRRLGADGIMPPRHDDPIPAVLAAIFAQRQREIPTAIHALVKSLSSDALGGGVAAIVATVLAADGMFDLALSDSELIALGRGAGATVSELSAAMLGGVTVDDRGGNSEALHRRLPIPDAVTLVACEIAGEASVARDRPVVRRQATEPGRDLASALSSANEAGLERWFETRHATHDAQGPVFHKTLRTAARQAGAFGLLPTRSTAALVAIAPRARVDAVAAAISDAGANLRIGIAAQPRGVAEDWRRVIVHPACDEASAPAVRR
jgi:hypothetical protein